MKPLPLPKRLAVFDQLGEGDEVLDGVCFSHTSSVPMPGALKDGPERWRSASPWITSVR